MKLRNLELFCVYEASYSKGFMAAMGSLGAWADSRFYIRVIVALSELSQLKKDINYLKYFANLNLKFVISIIPTAIDDNIKNVNYEFHFNESICYRIYYFLAVKNCLNISIYFDLDTIWKKTPLHVFDYIDAEFELMAVPQDNPERKNLEIDRDGLYFNSGVLVFNFESKLEENKKLLAEAKNQINILKSTSIYLDQDALNAAYKGKWKALPTSWNLMTGNYDNKNRNEVIILHASGSEKPWHFPNNHPYKFEYKRIYKRIKVYRYDVNMSIVRIFKKIKKIIF